MDNEIIRQTAASPILSIKTSPICFIYNLTTDILESIFIRCARSYFREDRGHPIHGAPSWVNISYVSRRWRDISLNCPILWTYLFVSSSRWTEELLARSKQASLKVNVNLHRWDQVFRGSRFVEQVMVHVERIEHFYLNLPVRDYEVLSKLSSPAPRLRHLQIMTEGYPEGWYLLLFCGDTPSLRTVELVDCPSPWYSLTLSRLTALHLSHIPIQFQQNMVDFLSTLGRMQDLQHLHLNDTLSSATGFLSSPAFYGFQKIKLPHISTLSLFAPLSTVIAFLSCIDIPPEAEVKLEPDCQVEEISLIEYDMFCSVLAERYGVSAYQAPSPLQILSLDVVYTLGGWAKLSFGTSKFSSSIHDLPLQILLSLDPSRTAEDRDYIITRICCSMPLSNVQVAHVIDPPSSLHFWTNVLGHIPDLRHLKLSNGSMPDLAFALSFSSHDFTGDQDGHANPSPRQVLVPALEELELHQISFLATPERSADSGPVVDLRSLCDALATRTEPRGRLSMTQCDERISDYCSLRKFDLEGRWGGGDCHTDVKVTEGSAEDQWFGSLTAGVGREDITL